jgi:hypothetical protein
LGPTKRACASPVENIGHYIREGLKRELYIREGLKRELYIREGLKRELSAECPH